MTSKDSPPDLIRIVLALLLLGILISASFIVLEPFLLALIWATTIVVASWPVMLAVQRKLKNRRGLAVLVMTSSLVVVLMFPLVITLSTIVGNIGVASHELQELVSHKLPEPPK